MRRLCYEHRVAVRQKRKGGGGGDNAFSSLTLSVETKIFYARSKTDVFWPASYEAVCAREWM